VFYTLISLNPKIVGLLYRVGIAFFATILVTSAQTPLQHWNAGVGTTVDGQNRVMSWTSAGTSGSTANALGSQTAPSFVANEPQISAKSCIGFGITLPIMQPLYFPHLIFDTATVFIVANLPQVANQMHFLVAGETNTTYNGGFWLGGTQSDVLGFGWGAGPPYNNLQSNVEVTGWQVYAMKNNKLFLNGVETGQTWNSIPQTTRLNHFGGIDLGWAGNSYIFRGYLAEMIIYPTHLTDAQIAQRSDSLINAYLPTLDLGPPTLDTCATQLILEPLNNAHFKSYLWNTGATTRSITIEQDGVYWVEVQGFGRTQRDTITLSGLTTPPLISLQSDTVLCKENPFYIHAIDPSGATISWQNGLLADSILVDKEGVFAYTKTFTTTNGLVCSIQSQARNVTGIIVPQFVASQPCLGDSTNLTNTSQVLLGNLDSLEWLIMGQTITGTSLPKYLFPSSGQFPVRLVVHTDLGCTDTVVQNVIVKSSPTANFTWDKECKGTFINFSNQSIIPVNEAVSNYAWVAPPLANSPIVNPSLLFPTNIDTAIVSLIVNLQNGCSDQITIAVPVNKFVTASYDMVTPQDTLCQFLNYEFQSNPQSVNTSIQQLTWRLNNQVISNEANPTISFPQSGNQGLRLTVRSTDGCSDSLNQIIRVRPKPVAKIIPSQTLGIPPFEITLSNASTGNYQYLEWSLPDGTNPAGQGPIQFTIPDTGLYFFSLKVDDNIQCTDETQISVRGVLPELSAEAVSLTCVQVGDEYEATFTVRNTSSVLPISEMALSWTLENADRITQNWSGNLPPGVILPFKFSGTLLPRTKPGYCCANIESMATTLPNNQRVEGQSIKRCVPFSNTFTLFNPYPNPAKEAIGFFVSSPFEDIGEVRISDYLGKIRLSRRILFKQGLNQIELNTDFLIQGTYFLTIQLRDEMKTVKFVILQ